MTLDATSTYASTNEVARALGVSVSTVKRWVDEGILPAHKTPGGHRKVRVADVLELARREVLPQADLGLLLNPRPRRREPDPATLAAAFHDALVSGDAPLVRSLLLGSYRHGSSIESLADQVIEPALKQIGLDWETGRIDVMEEHRASQLCAATLYELKALLEDRAGQDRPRAVGGAPAGDPSSLPTLLAQMVLLDAGWDAVNLGPNTPMASFEKALVELQPRLLWLSLTHPIPAEDFVQAYGRLYQKAVKAGVAVAVGGRALVESLRCRMPYTTHGDSLRHLAAFARTLHPRPARPPRGRPRSR